MTTPSPENLVRFDDLGIDPRILEQLHKLNFVTPTPIQHQSIPTGLEGKDLVGIAQTGTGKTMAFGIPLIQRILNHGGFGLVVLPTRELALQVEESLSLIGKALGIRTAVFIGGASMYNQKQMIRNKPHILIATPGRLIDHMEQRTITLKGVGMLVLDEADRMLDMGFAPQINKILAAVPTERQTMLFSATMPHDIMNIATKHMKLPIRIEVAPQGTAAERVAQEIFMVRKDDKPRLLLALLEGNEDTVLVFSRTKHGASKLTKFLVRSGHKSAELHANRSQAQRKEALDGFKSGKYRLLVATDIAARGIDVTGIGLVVNYDLPQNSEDYVHRIGRTGRAGREGKAVSFVLPEQRNDVRAIERLIRSTLKVSPLPKLPAHEVPLQGPPPELSRSTSRPPSPAGRPQGGRRPGGAGGFRRGSRRSFR
jgi:ATP-dependent RNA helicase RhlE